MTKDTLYLMLKQHLGMTTTTGKLLYNAIISLLCCSSRFRAGIKDLEVMMQNVISSAFETVTTVEQGVEVLDVFMHLSSREVGRLFG